MEALAINVFAVIFNKNETVAFENTVLNRGQTE